MVPTTTRVISHRQLQAAQAHAAHLTQPFRYNYSQLTWTLRSYPTRRVRIVPPRSPTEEERKQVPYGRRMSRSVEPRQSRQEHPPSSRSASQRPSDQHYNGSAGHHRSRHSGSSQSTSSASSISTVSSVLGVDSISPKTKDVCQHYDLFKGRSDGGEFGQATAGRRWYRKAVYWFIILCMVGLISGSAYVAYPVVYDLGWGSTTSDLRNVDIIEFVSTQAPTTIVLDQPSEDPLVATTSGQMRGIRLRAYGSTIHAYYGVPYARPPVGGLRFERPQPYGTWTGIWDATNFRSACVQFRPADIETPWMPAHTNGSEDCLYLNIWSPVPMINEDPMPIMVWFHGGAFFSGSANLELYQGEQLAGFGRIIVVTVNYRLGAFGFLNSGLGDIAAGNQGLYDQAMALTWIHDNAKNFGGNASAITLFGQSAGATSAGLHAFSPMTRDLFHRIIMQSGSPLFPKNYFDNSIEKSNEFAILAGCSDSAIDLLNDPEAVIDCLKDKPVEELLSAHKPMFDKYKIPFFPRPGDEFLPALPHELIHDPHLAFRQQEVLIGSTADEGSFFLHLFFPDFFRADGVNKSLNADIARKFITQAYSFIPQNQANLMSRFFLNHLSNSSSFDQVLKATHDIIGDSGFVCPAVHLSEALNEKRNVTVYHYLFEHRPQNSPWADWMGSTHLDEVDFVFGGPLRNPAEYNQSEIEFSMRLMSAWTQFARNGTVPDQLGKKWPRYGLESPLYMSLAAQNSTIGKGPHLQSCSLWKIVLDSFL